MGSGDKGLDVLPPGLPFPRCKLACSPFSSLPLPLFCDTLVIPSPSSFVHLSIYLCAGEHFPCFRPLPSSSGVSVPGLRLPL
jgi:hypothetical protein